MVYSENDGSVHAPTSMDKNPLNLVVTFVMCACSQGGLRMTPATSMEMFTI